MAAPQPASSSPRSDEATPLLSASSRRSESAKDGAAERHVVADLFRRIRRKFKPPRVTGEGTDALTPSVLREVRVLYLLASLTGMMLTTTTPMLLYYLQYIGYATTVDVSFFVLISAIQTAVPVAGHAGLGALTARFGVRRTVCVTAALASCALLILAHSRESRWIFACAFIFHSFSRSIRVARTVRIAEIVPTQARTHVMSIHMFCSPLGSATGPLLWVLCSQFSGDFHLFSSLHLNKFTLDYFAAALLAASIALISYFGLSDSTPTPVPSPNPLAAPSNETQIDQQDSVSAESYPPLQPTDPADTDINFDIVHVRLSDGTNSRINTSTYQRNTFLYFLFQMFSVSLASGLVSIGFQPILIRYYDASASELGIIYTAILVFGLIPPLFVAFLSKYLQDRQILLTGLIIKLIGVSLFLPIFGKIHEWQVIIGFMLVFKASIFFWTAAMSLFTKLLGPMSNGTLLGILSSAAQIGPALAQFFFAEWTFRVFGSVKYASFAIPVAMSTLMVVWPSYWQRLDSDDEFTSELLSQYEILQSKRKSKH